MQFFRRRRERGRPPHPDVLTPAEWRVLEQVRQGRTNAETAVRLGISVNTVRYHVSNMLAKTGTRDRAELAAWEGEPVDVPRSPSRRFGLAAPWMWLRESGWFGKSVAVTAVAAVTVAGVVTIASLNALGDEGGAPAAVPTPESTPTPVVEEPEDSGEVDDQLPHAPDGRTGDAVLDDLIERLLNDDAETLAQEFAGVTARERPDPDDDEQIHAAAEWAERLASLDRSLYAVAPGHPQVVPPREVDVVLAVSAPGVERHGWSFAVDGGDVVDINVHSGSEPTAAGRPGDLIVLPPPEDLPQPPPAHALDHRSGDPGVDSLVALVEAGDGAGLAAAIEYEQRACEPGSQPPCAQGVADGEVEALLMRRCGMTDAWLNEPLATERLGELAAEAHSLHAVAEVPDGHVPGAARLLMFVTEPRPFEWESFGVYEREGRITGLHSCHQQVSAMYPSSRQIVERPSDDTQPPDADRRSGVATVDTALEALRSAESDAALFADLIDFGEIECVAEQLGLGAPPLCEDAEPEGTLLPVLAVAHTHGSYLRADQATEHLVEMSGRDWRLYSVVDLGEPAEASSFERGEIESVLVDPDATGYGSVVAILFSDEGISMVRYSTATEPEQLLRGGREPVFLVPPPGA